MGKIRCGCCGVGIFALALVCLLGGCLSGSCDRLFFHPGSGPVTISETAKGYFDISEIWFRGPSGERLSGWKVLTKYEKPLGVVVHFHGNAGTIQNALPLVGWMSMFGYHVIVFDYRNFGNSEGIASLDTIREDSVLVTEQVASLEEFRDLPLILYGQSLGGAMAIYAAAESSRTPDALIVAGTFDSYRGIASRVATWAPTWLINWLISGKAEPYECAQKVTCPTLQIHSVDDEIVPYECGVGLQGKFGGPYSFMEVKEQGHLEEVLYQPWRDEFLRRLSEMLPSRETSAKQDD